jgi:tRNA pseudouridine55 synthase
MTTAKRKKLNINGWINLDKPAGVTSSDMVNKIRYTLQAAKAGHAGTLDPLATGILPIALGEATKVLPYVTDSMKTYVFTVTWGEARDTDDAEGKVIAQSPIRPDAAQIQAALPRFIGTVKQVPPQFSALKINGERAYDLARAGTAVDLPARDVFIENITLISHTADTATLECRCGKGTYVRSIARDLAEILGTKGYISALRRTEVGCFSKKTAISLESFLENALKSDPQTVVLPLRQALDDIPALTITAGETTRLKQGQTLECVSRMDVQRLSEAGLDPRITDDALAIAIHEDKEVALLSVTGPRLVPVRVFNI